MESKGVEISSDALAQGMKGLSNAKTKQRTDSLDYDQQVASTYEKMYQELNGDVDAIFEKLNESARKAKKYPPKDAQEFGIKYAQGFYTDITADAKA